MISEIRVQVFKSAEDLPEGAWFIEQFDAFFAMQYREAPDSPWQFVYISPQEQQK